MDSKFKLIGEGSFYKVYRTMNNTVIRLSKNMFRVNENELFLLSNLSSVYVNKMIKYKIIQNWSKTQKLYRNQIVYEMEAAEFNLVSYFDQINIKIDDVNTLPTRLTSICFVNSEIWFLILKFHLENSKYTKEVEKRDSITPDCNQSFDNSSILTDPFTDELIEHKSEILLESSEDCLEEPELQMVDCYEVLIRFAKEYNCNKVIVLILCNLVCSISAALEYLHLNNVIHMDIKPANILIKKLSENSLDVDNKQNNIKSSNNHQGYTDYLFMDICNEPDILNAPYYFILCDLNISQFNEGFVDLDGDPRYMAPEILRNRAYFTSDIYSLGLIILEYFPESISKTHFIGSMVSKHHSRRPTAAQVKDYFLTLMEKIVRI